MHIVFVPGGPGFSSLHEQAILGPEFDRRGWRSTFWTEPWRESAAVPVSWQAYVGDLASTLGSLPTADTLVVAHSFAIHPVAEALRQVAPQRPSVVLVAPVFDLRAAHRAIVGLAAQGLGVEAPASCERMQRAVDRSSSFFDPDMQEALGIASTDASLFPRYWRSAEAFEGFAQTLAAPSGRFDMHTFVTLLSDLESRRWVLPAFPAGIRLTALLGGDDPIVCAAQAESTVREWATDPRVTTFPGCGHWVHLECVERFCALLAEGHPC